MSNKDKWVLHSLSSTKDLKDTTYDDYLTQAIEDESIRNVAISGKYGSGKSSVVDSYFERSKKKYLVNYGYNTLKVSFAKFEGIKQELSENNKLNTRTECGVSSNDISENIIYTNIINQVIYQIDEKKIPLTGFRVKRTTPWWQKIWISGTILLAISLFTNNPDLSNNNVWNIVRMSGFYLGLFGILFYLLGKLKLDKLSVIASDVTTNIDFEKDDLFEKYGDEIVYLFQQSGKHILIVEDLDRFNDIGLFETLRELNTKLNVKGSQWTFIYLIKDDMFLDANDRVKFFDVLIPIVPYMTKQNSYDQLESIFELNNKENKVGIHPRLVYLLSLFVDDYRMLKNIHNEYKVIQNTTKTKEFNDLLAMVSYKNLFPLEFEQVQNGKGVIEEIFNKFREDINDEMKRLENKRKDLIFKKQSTAAKLESECLFLFSQTTPIYYQTQYRNSRIESLSVAKDIIENNVKISVDQVYFIEYELFKEENEKYHAEVVPVVHFEDELASINSKYAKLKNKSLGDGVDQNASDGEHDKFIKTLIREKYIRQNYQDVINRFYGNDTTREFMKNLIIGEGRLVNAKLPNIKGIWHKLSDNDFDKEQIQNIDILMYAKNYDRIKYSYLIENAGNYMRNSFFEDVLKNEKNLSTGLNLLNDFISMCPNYVYTLEKLEFEYVDVIVNQLKYDDSTENTQIIIDFYKNSDQAEILEIINEENHTEDVRSGILENSEFKCNLYDIRDKNKWEYMLRKDRVLPNLSNVRLYLDEFNTISEELGMFVNSEKFINDLEDTRLNYLELFVKSSVVSREAFEQIFKFFDLSQDVRYEKTDFIHENVVEKLKYLLSKEKVIINEPVLVLLSENEMPLPEIAMSQEILDVIVEMVDLGDINIENIGLWIGQIISEASGSVELNIWEFIDRVTQVLTKENVLELVRYDSPDEYDKFRDILEKENIYRRFRIQNNESNVRLLNIMVTLKYIDTYEVVAPDKLKVV